MNLKRKQRGSIILAAFGVPTGAPAPVVSARANGAVNSILNTTCYAGAQFQSDGDEYEYNAAGALSQLTTWLDSGDAADVWVERIITGGSPGTWNNLDPGTGRHQLSTTRSFRINRTTTGTNTVTGYFKFWDAASGGSVLQQTSDVLWSAERDFDPCPICCFTPETPIQLASGIVLPISKIRKGDDLLIYNPHTNKQFAEKCTGIITRQNRNMFRVKFVGGHFVDLSDDHPLQVEGKGPRSIYPQIEYKDIGLPETLAVGDEISGAIPGVQYVIESIEPISYNGIVYTLENTLFYANGLLVY